MVAQVDAHELKRKLAGTGPEANINCAVVSDGHTAYMRVDRHRPPRRLLEELVKDLGGGSAHCVHKYIGTVYADAFPGVLLMTLDKPASPGTGRLLRTALRGSGYKTVKFVGFEDDEEL